MKDFPSCFGENGVQFADSCSSSATKTSQNLVTCVYQCRSRGQSLLITVTWSKNLMNQSLLVEIDDTKKQHLFKVEMKPCLFSKKKGLKSFNTDSNKIDVYWDLSSAKFERGSEPIEGFYLVVIFNKSMVLLLGDLKKEALEKTNANPNFTNGNIISKKEHIYGKRVFIAKDRFHENGKIHNIVIECDTIGVSDPSLLIRVDCKTVIQVKHLLWKFRGSHTMLVDGREVEFFWDVHDWLFGESFGCAIFMFKTCFSTEKLWTRQPFTHPNTLPRSHSRKFRDSSMENPGFSLILYAWKSEEKK